MRKAGVLLRSLEVSDDFSNFDGSASRKLGQRVIKEEPSVVAGE
jgi:hypothetical protein